MQMVNPIKLLKLVNQNESGEPNETSEPSETS